MFSRHIFLRSVLVLLMPWTSARASGVIPEFPEDPELAFSEEEQSSGEIGCDDTAETEDPEVCSEEEMTSLTGLFEESTEAQETSAVLQTGSLEEEDLRRTRIYQIDRIIAKAVDLAGMVDRNENIMCRNLDRELWEVRSRLGSDFDFIAAQPAFGVSFVRRYLAVGDGAGGSRLARDAVDFIFRHQLRFEGATRTDRFRRFREGLTVLEDVAEVLEGAGSREFKTSLVAALKSSIAAHGFPFLSPVDVPTGEDIKPRLEGLFDRIYHIAERNKASFGFQLAIAFAGASDNYAATFARTTLPWKERIISAAADTLDSYQREGPLDSVKDALLTIATLSHSYVRFHIWQSALPAIDRFVDDDAETEELHGDSGIIDLALAALKKHLTPQDQELFFLNLLRRRPELLTGADRSRLRWMLPLALPPEIVGSIPALVDSPAERIETRAAISRELFDLALWSEDKWDREEAREVLGLFGMHLSEEEQRTLRDALIRRGLEHGLEQFDRGLTALLGLENLPGAPASAADDANLVGETAALLRAAGWDRGNHERVLINIELAFLTAAYEDPRTARAAPIAWADGETALEQVSLTNFQVAIHRVRWLNGLLLFDNPPSFDPLSILQYEGWTEDGIYELELLLAGEIGSQLTELQSKILDLCQMKLNGDAIVLKRRQ